jgi:alpha-D-ribose 1-methylphosphonate 5-triphosphate synthase subunit PhnH
MPLVPASAAIALTLFDHDTPVWLDAAMARSTQLEQWLRFHTGAPITQDASSCAFALIADPVALPDFEMFSCGSHEYPDRSSTLIIQVASLTEGAPLVLRGPGIAGMAKVSVAAGMPNFLSSLARNHALFPCGVDILLVAEDALIGIPRTTSVIHEGH